ncbi:S-adenosyl-L-methionine-dependent methyltransferase [Cladorrhinum samala]|uniref:Arsenite methyltransferase n=1 Tax=Cladorrhinum samala TaxID=585594 RepID=A0AAV9HSA5_9PEZI|nr:S-adenosyl-L-methionine-dependent methyltransferase [Cladorrhinum samala]
METAEIYNQVREHYSAASRTTSVKYGEAVAKSFGYSQEELANIPEDANLGLSCGNPLAITSIKEGETVIDLGSGAGFDIFLASTKIGPAGKAIGIDMNDDMLARAEKIKAARSITNASFIKANITSVPLEPDTADLIISNCVVNLVPYADKHLVFKEMHRLLKPGGRVAISDILAKKPLPEKLRNDIALYVGCIAGAAEVKEYEQWLSEAGFNDVVISDTKADLNVYLETNEDGTKKGDCCAPASSCCAPAEKGCCAPAEEGCCAPTAKGCCAPAEKADGCCSPASTSVQATTADDSERPDLNEFVGSYKIYAVKN